MSIPDCGAILAWLNDPDGGGDRAMRNVFISRNRKFVQAMREIVEEEDQRRWNVGFASIEEITCLQVTLWDNWPRFETSGTKEHYKTFRWGLGIEAWTCRPEVVRLVKDGWQRAYIGNFKTGAEVLEQAFAAQSGLNPITSDYYALLEQAVASRPDWHFAMLEHKAKGDGTIFPEKQFVMIDLNAETGDIEQGAMVIGRGLLNLPAFSKLDINRKPYAGRKLTFKKTKGGPKRPGKVIYNGMTKSQSRYAIPTPNDRFKTFQTGNALADKLDSMRSKNL